MVAGVPNKATLLLTHIADRAHAADQLRQACLAGSIAWKMSCQRHQKVAAPIKLWNLIAI